MAATGNALEKKGPNLGSAFISWKWVTVASFLIIALIVGILMATKSSGSDVDNGTEALIEAFSKQRLIEPRLSGGFKGGSFRSSRDGAPEIKTRELERARGLLLDAVAEGEPGAELAYARLLLSEGEKLTEALTYLRRELARSPEAAEPHNDLGVCLSLQGKIEDAIDEFEAALKQKPDMPEALLNRGLCYERLLLRDAAAAEYNRLVTLERDPGWLTEVKQRYERMASKVTPRQRPKAVLVADFRAALADGKTDEARKIADENYETFAKYAFEDLHAEYLEDAVAGKQQEAQSTLIELVLIGKTFSESKDDLVVADLADHLRTLPNSEWSTEREIHREYWDAAKMAKERDYFQARVRFETLSQQFASMGNHLYQVFSISYVSSCLYSSGQLSASLEKVKEALLEVEKRKWPYTRAQLLSQLGVAYSRLGQDSLAIGYCKQALTNQAGMSLLDAKSLQHMGTAYWHLGDLDSGLSCFHKSTGLYFASVPSPDELVYNYLQIADIYRLRGNHSLALLDAKQAVTFLNQFKDNSRAAQTSSFVAVEHARMGEVDEADREVARAFEYLKAVEPGKRAYTEPLVLTRSAEIASLHGDLKRALEMYRKAEQLVPRSEEKKLPLIRILRGRSEAYSQAKEFDKARRDLARAVDEIEGYRAGLADIAARRSFLDASQGIFDQLISLNLDVFNREAEAFRLSEQSRARSLLDEFSPRPPAQPGHRVNSTLPENKQVKPVELKQVMAELPDNLRLMTYSVTERGTYLFLVTHNRLEVARSTATAQMLDRLVADCVSGLKNKATPIEELKEKSRDLYRLLIEPVEQRISDGKLLCIVPDKALHFLPFAALVDKSGRYFVESQRMIYAPSASVFVQCLREGRAKGLIGDEAILAVGNPQFNRDAFPLLGNLRDAEREASEAASFYPRKVLLTGAQATEQEVRRKLTECNVAHLALHCLVEEKALVLASSGGASGGYGPPPSAESSADDGLLYLTEIYGISLPRTRLVVLSACQSGLGQYYRGEGIVSLARPFLALRVPTVVASLWSVDSEATAELMIEFHRERKNATQGVADSLRAAQITMASRAPYEHPYYWAPFITVGAD